MIAELLGVSAYYGHSPESENGPSQEAGHILVITDQPDDPPYSP